MLWYQLVFNFIKFQYATDLKKKQYGQIIFPHLDGATEGGAGAGGTEGGAGAGGTGWAATPTGPVLEEGARCA